MQLKHGTVLQGGRYRIEKMLGQGGFGITYLAFQPGLERYVAIKEFFMKEHCNRDADTSHVSVPSVGSRELVTKFKEKFIKEAQMIAAYEHPNIVTIYDNFEENGTAYYVMKYYGDPCGNSTANSLSALPLPLACNEAAVYIRQVASALSYLHERNTMHLDVKPSNVLIDREGNAVLIDFGVSKRYDKAGHQTSSTPVGLSHGYAPGEQYQQSTLGFSPTTDIYALGATYYKLVTGDTPPDQNEVTENGLPPFPQTVPSSIAALIDKAMQPRRKDRPQSIAEFLGLLDDALAAAAAGDETKVDSDDADTGNKTPTPSDKKKSRHWVWWVLVAIILIGAGVFAALSLKSDSEAVDSANQFQTVPQHEIDKAVYDSLMTAASAIALDDLGACNKAIKLYGEALDYEEKYVATEYSSMFPGEASTQILIANATAEKLEKEAEAQKAKAEQEKKQYEADLIDNIQKAKKQQQTSTSQRATSAKTTGTSTTASKTGTHKGHEWVDLGLSVKWATCNVGASSPGDYGNYYAWGETKTKSSYTEDNCASYGKSWGDIGGNSSRDAARANWGGNWRMPTMSELEELQNNCTWTWTTQNDHKGCKVTGPNGQSIFLPAAGCRYGDLLSFERKDGNYWSSTHDEYVDELAFGLCFGESYQYTHWDDRYLGHSVRPVLKD